MRNSFRTAVVVVSLFLVVSGMTAQPVRGLKSSSTAHFRIQYDKYVADAKVQIVRKELERSYDLFQGRLKFTPGRNVTVYLYSTRQQPRAATFDDAWYEDGKIVLLSAPLFDRQPALASVVNRVVADAFAHSVIMCPPWVAETYALAMGEDFSRFGTPTRVTVASFSDLEEDLTRSDREQERKASFANLSATAQYFTEQFGADKFDAVLRSLRGGKSVEDSFNDGFGVKFSELERSWADYMHGLVKK